jgi:hypothetical protein
MTKIRKSIRRLAPKYWKKDDKRKVSKWKKKTELSFRQLDKMLKIKKISHPKSISKI